MKYEEVGFRAVYHQFVTYPVCDTLRSGTEGFPHMNQANCVLGYGYIDREAGLTIELLAGGVQEGDSFHFFDGDDSIRSITRIGAVMEEEFVVIDDSEGILNDRFASKLDDLKVYDAGEEVEESRTMGFLDASRNEQYPDDVLVYLMREGLEPEGCWVRITGLGDHWIMGTLLNEPFQAFGYHEGEQIGFFVRELEDGSIQCYTDMTPSRTLTPEDLEDGSVLKEAIRAFSGNRTEDNFFEVLELLRDSFVWVPCTAVLSERDRKQWDDMIEQAEDPESLVGETVTSQDQIRLIPDILRNGEDYFFPAFTSEEEMGEYGEGFSRVQNHMLQIIPLARNNERNVKGIVINPFTEPFVLDSEIFDIVEKMKSRLMLN